MIRVYLLGFLTRRGLLALAGIAILCAAVIYGGPYLTFFGRTPLATEEARTGTVWCIVGLFFGGTFLRLYLARRANARMIKSLLDAQGIAVGPEPISVDEGSVVQARFEEALATLKDQIFPGRAGDSHLFELPWYAVIGPPGSGKTSILRHSGLDFPLSPKLGGEPVAGVGGTRHCDWWFANEAVLIDTAGRYVTQDQDAVDGSEWRSFLDLLKTHRSRRPLDGVLLVVSLRDVLLHEPERKRRVAALRARLTELTRTSGIGLPIYLVIAKCDLVPGFAEYFAGLNESERDQVWGMTFPIEGDPSERLPETFDRIFSDLSDRLEQGVRELVHAERNLSRRGQIYLFPKEFEGLRKDLAGFLQDVFRPNRFEAASRLRGVYFTSALQEGIPFDRTAAAFGRGFGLPNPQRPPQSGPGRPYFITRVLTEVAFAEQGLAGVDPRLERKLLVAQNTGYATAALLVVSLSALWWAAESRSEARIAATGKALGEVEIRLQQLPAQMDPAALLPVLQAVDSVRSESGRGDILAALDGLGLSATLSLVPAAEELRRQLLLGRLYPVFADRLGEHIGSVMLRGGDTDTLRGLLRSYLMLGDPERFDAMIVKATVRDEARLAFPTDQDGAGQLNRHLDDLVALLPKPLPLDWRLVEAARARLMRTPRSEQVYARLLREASHNPRLRPIDLGAVIGPGVLRFTPGPGNVSVSGIPSAFTREAFYNFVLPRLPILIREEIGIDWVSGGQGSGDGLVQTGTREVMDRYASEYIQRWRTAMNSVRLVSASDRQQALLVVQTLSGPDSPLERLISILRNNTDLPLPGDQGNQAQGVGQATASLPGPAGMLAGGLVAGVAASAANAAAMAALGEGPWPGTTIAAPFKPLTELILSPGGGQPAVVRIRELFSGAYNTLSSVSTASDPHEAAYKIVTQHGGSGADAIALLRTDSALRPEPVRGILRSVAALGTNAVIGEAIDHINDVWRRDVLPQCQAALDQRYPLFGDAQDEVSLRDFSDMFRPGGILDEFFKKHLAPFVTEQRNGFAPVRIDGDPLPLHVDALAQFYRARAIRNAFFSGAGAAPSLKFSVKPSFLDPRLLRATLTIDGRDIVYRHEATRAYDIDWPTRTDASTVTVTLIDLEGKETRVERDGAWALLRFVDMASLSARSGADVFGITVKAEDGASATYRLRAASVNNPFNLGALRAFRCPDAL